MDIATLVGLLAGAGLVVWGMMSGGSISAFIDGPSIAIVLGGATGTALIAFPLKTVLGVAKVVKHAFFAKSQDPRKLIEDLVRFAEVARRDGILALENMTDQVDDPFLVRGIQMAVDGTDPEFIEQIMMAELESLQERHATGKAIFETIGKYAPAFGMIGTLIGLVKMLQNMDDPSQIGPGMATALLTTLYGALIANLIVLPIADKLAKRSAEETLLKLIVIRGVMSIQSGDNPRIVEQKLNTYLPPAMRVQRDAGKAQG